MWSEVLQATRCPWMWSKVQQKCCVVLFNVEYPIGKKVFRIRKYESAMAEKVDGSFGCCEVLLECVEYVGFVCRRYDRIWIKTLRKKNKKTQWNQVGLELWSVFWMTNPIKCLESNRESKTRSYYYYYYYHHHLLYAGYLYSYSWDKLCP